MRGLTHRAVDRTAGLPEGSASYYFRTRQALLQATVERLAELTGADMLASAALMDSPVSESPVSESPVAESPVAESPVAESPVAESPVAESPVVDSAVVDIAVLSPAGDELNAFGALAAALVESWLTAGRERQLARYELSLEATRRPELRQTLVTTGAAIRAVIAGRFAAAGVPEPAQRAADFAAFIDGLLFDQIAGAGNRKLTTRDVRAAIGTFLAGVTGSRP
jgi:AcrR family transcriptional regulator